MHTFIQTTVFLTVVLGTTVLIDRASLHLLIWIVSRRALARHRHKAGGKNRLVLHGLNNSRNCRTPLAVADAVVSFCVFDVAKSPLRIHATIPAGKYWSLAGYGTDTTNFFSLNDCQVTAEQTSREPEYQTLAVVLCRPDHHYQAQAGELVIDTPTSNGILLIRVLLNDPEDKVELDRVMTQQRLNRVELTS